jgi:4-diphosphocytidyl-2-C-methyl-D-erythritol kinase
MGGGSSDAASVILGLDRLFDCRLSAGEMAAIGAKVGSDVPFFLGDGPALVSGRGELLEPLPPRDDLHFVVAWPGRPVSTPWAYARLDAERPSDAAEPDPTKEELLAAWRKPPSAWPFANSFTGAIVKAVPEIGLLLDFLRGAGAGFAEMSGSGSAVFGLFAGQEEAESAAWRLRRAVLAGKLPSGSLVWTCAALARLPTLG